MPILRIGANPFFVLMPGELPGSGDPGSGTRLGHWSIRPDLYVAPEGPFYSGDWGASAELAQAIAPASWMRADVAVLPKSASFRGDEAAWKWYDVILGELIDFVGGQLFTVSLGGSLSPAGALLKEVRKPLGGSLSLSGALINEVRKFLGGAISPSGLLIRETRKVMAGTLSFAGVLVNRAQKVLGGAISPVGALTKEARKLLAGVVSFAGSLVNQVRKILVGTVSPTGALMKQARKVLTGALSFAGALANAITVPVVLVRKLRATISQITKLDARHK